MLVCDVGIFNVRVLIKDEKDKNKEKRWENEKIRCEATGHFFII
jgi:hypothetical protein